MAEQTSSPKRSRLILISVVLVPYLVSMGLPAVTGDLDAPDTTAPGIQALIMGFIFNPIAWFANVMVLIGLRRVYRGRRALVAGVTAFLCAALPLVWRQLKLEAGYFVWLSSTLLLVVVAAVARHRERARAG